MKGGKAKQMKKLTVFALAAVMTLAFAVVSFAAPKDIEFKTVGDEGQVTFSHAKHLEKLGGKCPECHPKVFQMKKGADNITMAAMKEGKFCGGACHNGTKAFDASAPENCAKCHVKK